MVAFAKTTSPPTVGSGAELKTPRPGNVATFNNLWFKLATFGVEGRTDARPPSEPDLAEAKSDDWLDQPVWTEEEADASGPGDSEDSLISVLEHDADAHADRIAGSDNRPAAAQAPAVDMEDLPVSPQLAANGVEAKCDSCTAAPSEFRAMDPRTRGTMESAFGHSFGDVRIETGAKADQANRGFRSLAYARDSDIAFADGWYSPHTPQGNWLLAHELAHVVQHRHGLADGVAAFRVRRIADVRSLVIEEHEGTVVPGLFAHMERALRRRDRLVRERLALVRPGTTAHTALTSMDARWPSFRRAASNPRFNPATGALPTVSAITAARTAEAADRRALPGGANRTVRAESVAFVTALGGYLRGRERLDAERREFRRFDTNFANADVTTLVNAIPHARFRPAEIKALVGQETADLTNAAVAGITGKTRGVVTHRRNRGGHVGLGQHTAAARTEAITWAAAQGVTIPATPDPRTVAAESIKLTAAFIGHIMQRLLVPALPAPVPAGDELKKLLFASYNGGFRRVADAAISFQAGRRVAYGWNDIRRQPRITGQMRNYVDGVVLHLS